MSAEQVERRPGPSAPVIAIILSIVINLIVGSALAGRVLARLDGIDSRVGRIEGYFDRLLTK